MVGCEQLPETAVNRRQIVKKIKISNGPWKLYGTLPYGTVLTRTNANNNNIILLCLHQELCEYCTILCTIIKETSDRRSFTWIKRKRPIRRDLLDSNGYIKTSQQIIMIPYAIFPRYILTVKNYFNLGLSPEYAESLLLVSYSGTANWPCQSFRPCTQGVSLGSVDQTRRSRKAYLTSSFSEQHSESQIWVWKHSAKARFHHKSS